MASGGPRSVRLPPHAGPSSARQPPFASNGHANPPHHAPSASQTVAMPGSLAQTVQMLVQLGAERNMQASQMQGLTGSNRKNSQFTTPTLAKLDKETEVTWVQAGRLAEAVGDWSRALSAYEAALRHSPFNVEALTQTANILRQQEKFVEAAEYFTRVIHLNEEAGEVWGALGHCYLMIDDLNKAYACYQQAILHIPDAKSEPKLWYGIGILYDRYGSLEHAEEAFACVIATDPNFEKANEIYFRLGIIYKQQKNSADSLQCFKYILHNPPRPLTEIDIWFQIGHVYEQQAEYDLAKDAYDRVLAASPNHAKVLQQLGGLYQRQGASFYDIERSLMILTKSLEQDSQDPFSWYQLGRAYMAGGNYGKAYEAYQQAVYRDGKNPAFWCSIGVLYYQINQFHDALDAYSRAIRINPYVSEVWHNLGALYESCNNQIPDAIDAYTRSVHLDPSNEVLKRRLEQIDISQQRGTPLSPPPRPKDISPASDNWQIANGSNTTVPAAPPAGLPGGPALHYDQTPHPHAPHRNGAGSSRPAGPPDGFGQAERDAMYSSRPGSRGRASLSTSGPGPQTLPQMEDEHNITRGGGPRSMTQMQNHQRNAPAHVRPRPLSPPLSPRTTRGPDVFSQQTLEYSPRGLSEEWERGRAGHGYRDHPPPQYLYSADGRGPPPLASPNTRAPLTRPTSSHAQAPPQSTALPSSAPVQVVHGEFSPREPSPAPSLGKQRRVSKGDKAPVSNGDKKKAASRKTRVATPTSGGPKLPPAIDVNRPPPSAGSVPSSAGTPSASRDEHDKAGMDALLALSGHASEAAPMPTPRKRSIENGEAGDQPSLKKHKAEGLSRSASGTPRPLSPAASATLPPIPPRAASPANSAAANPNRGSQAASPAMAATPGWHGQNSLEALDTAHQPKEPQAAASA